MMRQWFAIGILVAAIGCLWGAWHLSNNDPFVALATLFLRELAAVRSVIFPTRNDQDPK